MSKEITYQDVVVKDDPWGTRYRFHDKDGLLIFDRYYIRFSIHRIGGPAEIYYYDDGTVEKEVWYVKNVRHRETGPAEIHYDDDNKICYTGYWLFGVLIADNQDAFQKHLETKFDKSKAERFNSII